MTNIDHFVVAAANLSAGVKYVNQLLGVNIPYGGEHEKMGTHNHLMRLGSRLFLEVIAVNPKAGKPDCCRWFGLDDSNIARQLEHQPGLLTWVVNTADISALIAQNMFYFGTPTLMSRDHLSWYFGLPEDGNVFEGGTLPYIMQWNTSEHPAASMADQQCKFRSLDLYHPNPRWLQNVLRSIDAVELANLHYTDRRAHIVATFESPAGLKQLSSLTG